ncbi:acyl-CoA dehydrogenase family protein [Chloroflexota bacterium]
MEFDLTPEQKQLERDIHDYLKKKVLTPELEEKLQVGAELEDSVHNQLIRQMGADGWLGIGWPREYGGQARSPIEQYIFFDIAMGYYRIPFPMLALNTVGPTIMRVGTEEQKKRFLPPIVKGEMNICLGYTEPEAGSDLASLRTMAVRDGDDYIINGQKVFTSLAHLSDYVWLAARTNPDAPKHKGISIFMIDMKSPGFSFEPILTMSGVKTNYTFYDNIRVPKDCLIGEENMGWRYMSTQLGLERIAMVPHSHQARIVNDIIEWAKNTKINGVPVIEQPWVKSKLSDMVVETEILKLLNYRVAWLIAQGTVPFAEASMIKVFGAERLQRIAGTGLDIMGLYGQLQRGSKWAPLMGKLERTFRSSVVLTIGGGSSEVLRDIIAMVSLRMPRSR